ncbi:hypothetical protein PENANT_c070G03833 [Penicillium antarcticum]|uniref:Uncharacterized protein n=1 Tax=Penicillium antarcticum TaxID=416450 RepID=A0A1V6PPI7_9EURO|nr:hypothetical protein PENANT_c070G03833 [Penicillium antarcticum]
MGVTDSRVVIETLSAACREAEETEKDNIENLLTKREFINLLRHLWTQIPVGTRRSIGRPTYHDPRTRSRKRLKKKHSSKISISETLRANVLRWKERPLLFFTEDGSTLDLDDLPLAQSYKYLTKSQVCIRTIPLSGPVREDEIRSLKTRGILDVEGKENLNDLANALFGKLWEKIEDSITRTTHFTGTGEGR